MLKTLSTDVWPSSSYWTVCIQICLPNIWRRKVNWKALRLDRNAMVFSVYLSSTWFNPLWNLVILRRGYLQYIYDTRRNWIKLKMTQHPDESFWLFKCFNIIWCEDRTQVEPPSAWRSSLRTLAQSNETLIIFILKLVHMEWPNTPFGLLLFH
jgi:hypothetical protein